MSSPNEPGQSAPADRPENGDTPSETPPWQNPTRTRPEGSTGRPAGDSPVRPPAPPAGGGSGTGDPSRYVTGYAAPDVSSVESRAQRADPDPVRGEPRTDRTEVAAIEPYPSELPDLSGSPAKVPQPRKSAVAEPGRPAVPAVAPASGLAARLQVGGRPRGPVRATMQIRRIDPWSALKVSLLLNVALFFVWMIAVAFLYLVLGAMGVWNKLNSNVGDLLSSTSGGSGGDLVSAGSIFGGAALIGLINIVLLTAMAAIGAYIYNLSTDIVGGVEVTLADLD